MKRLAVALLVVVLGAVLLCLGASDKPTNQSGATASGTAPEVRYRGVNINPDLIQEGDIRILADEWNANIVRIWLGLSTWAPACSAAEGWPSWCTPVNLEKLDAVLDWCEAYGIRAVIGLFTCDGYNPHMEPEDGDFRLWGSPGLQQGLVSFWRSLAARYAGRGEVIYGYDLLNEPHTPSGAVPRAWNDLAAQIARAIREVDPEHAIVLECGYGSAANFEVLRPLEDSNVIYSFHFSEPNVFTHQGWGGNPDGLQYPSVQWDKDFLRDLLKPASEFKIRHSVHVYVGEIGVYCPADSASRCAYIRDCLDLFEEYEFDYTYWDYRHLPRNSLEHVGYDTSSKWIEQYVGATSELTLFQEYLSRNEVRIVAESLLERPRCVFDTSHWVASAESRARGMNLAWRLTALCDVLDHSDGPITREVLSNAALLVTGGTLGYPYAPSEVQAMAEFVDGGGAILFYGSKDWGINSLLASFGLQINPARVAASRLLAYEGVDPAAFYVREFSGPPEIANALVVLLVNTGARP